MYINRGINLKLLLPILLIISTIFSHIFFFPKIGYKFQPTEIVFIVLSLFFVFKYHLKIRFNLLTIDKSFIFLSLIMILSQLIYFEKIVFLKLIEYLYLIALYFLLSGSLRALEYKELKKVLKLSADIGFWILIGIGILGFVLYYFFDSGKFVLIYRDYPYFGDVFRIKGFSYSPNLYISLISFFTILKLAYSRLQYSHIVLVFILSIVSMTKEALLLIAVLFAIIFYKNNFPFKINLIPVLFAGILYVFLSYFIISFDNKESKVQSKEAVFKTEKFSVYPTTYFEVIKSGVLMTLDKPLFGVGLGNFRKELKEYQREGKYPKYFQTYDALDSYSGLVSQLGILYLFFLFAIFVITYGMVIKLPYQLKYPFILFFTYMLFESMALGTYHFRHYYIYIAIFSVIAFKKDTLLVSTHPCGIESLS